MQRRSFSATEFLEYGFNHREESKEIDELITLVEFLGCQSDQEVFYEKVYTSPWASHYDIEEEHEKLYKVSSIIT